MSLGRREQPRRPAPAAPALLLAALLAAGPGFGGCAGTAAEGRREIGPEGSVSQGASERGETTVRVATFNIKELSREKLERTDAAGHGTDPQLQSAAGILQRIRPDLLLINEIDFDPSQRANAALFLERYLAISQGGLAPLDYPHIFFEPVNTGLPSGFDLDHDGRTDSPGDALGFGRYPGQYGMALYSRFPFDRGRARSFRHLRWQSLPGHHMPDGLGGRPAWYGAEAAELPLSSKSHWDVPVRVGGRTLHALASHPTPPVFDGEEDRNGRRNFDEIRLWADYLSGGEAAAYLVDDTGGRGGLATGESFVLLGDLNADPFNDPGPYGSTAAGLLLGHPRIRDPAPRGPGGEHEPRPYDGPRSTRTAEWGRLDYVLPSRDLEVAGAGIFWPAPEDPLRRLVDGAAAASDHRLVWVDLRLP